jgi:hypothetical protein
MPGSGEPTRLRRTETGADGEHARAAHLAAYETARRAADACAMTEAALGLSRAHVFGADPGRIPALVFEAYQAAQGADRVRLAAALVRTWVYGGQPDRGVRFAREAVAGAEAVGDPALLAEALDSELLVHWGPDDYAERMRITSRLEDTVATWPTSRRDNRRTCGG